MKKLATSIFLMTLGLILTGYAILMPMLKVIGTRTTGIVTDVRRQGGTTIVGKSYSAGLPKGPVSVLYLKIFPRIHALEKYTRFSIGNLILIGTGILLISISLKQGKDIKRKGRK